MTMKKRAYFQKASEYCADRPLCVIWFVLLVIGEAPAYAEEPIKLETKQVPLKIVRPQSGDIAIELLRLPAGKFTTQDEKGKERIVEIRSFWISKFETRWEEYDVFWRALDLSREEHLRRAGSEREWREERTIAPYLSPYDLRDKQLGRDGYPVNSVTLNAARKYCKWLSQHTGKRFRLPTETEWEYACRAGDREVKIDAVAWFKENSDGIPHPVGKKQPNAWGLYDMLGNVAEYVLRDKEGDEAVVAGGAWSTSKVNISSRFRESYSKEWRKLDPQDPPDPDWLGWTRHDIGFRVVMDE